MVRHLGSTSIGAVFEEALRNLRKSRLGIYEVVGASGGRFQLRELISNVGVEAFIPSGFQGERGQLIMVRLVPPLLGETSYSVAMTTPYLLLGHTESDWSTCFGRHQVVAGTVGADERLQRHMKFGPDPTYWSEFVFYGYAGHRSDAIFVAGLPDRPETQPQHRSYDPKQGIFRD